MVSFGFVTLCCLAQPSSCGATCFELYHTTKHGRSAGYGHYRDECLGSCG